MVKVHLVGIPLDIHQQATEHASELMREFSHLAEVAHDSNVPSRLVALDKEMEQRFSNFTIDTANELDAAIQAGGTELHLTYTLPRDAGDAAAELGEMWKEVDRYCEDGRYLLALRTPDSVKSYREWFLGEFIRQTSGGEPISWPDWVKRQPIRQTEA